MDTKKPTKKAKVEAEAESLLPEPEAESKQPEETADAQADSDVATDVEDSAPAAEEEESAQAPKVEEAAHDVETQSTAQEVEDATPKEAVSKPPEALKETKALEADAQTQAKVEDSKPSNAQPIIYAGVVLVRNKTSKPLVLSPMQLGIYHALTIQSGEIVALPHKYARSLIMQQIFEEVKGQLYVVQPCAKADSK